MRKRSLLISSLVLIAGMVVVLHFRQAPSSESIDSPPEVVPEVLRSELELKEGVLVLAGSTNPFTGVFLERYPDDSQKSRNAVSGGRLNGLSEGWYTNQVLAVQEYFTNGVSHGLRKKWYANGNKESEAPISNGQIHGTFQRWDEDGWLTQEIEMKNGKADGLSRAYFPSGFIQTEVVMREGEVVRRESWADGERKPSSVN
jgi:antitoxin component YwqK of YwqJK toxin-antitoxin module